MKSAEALLHATGIFHTTAILKRALMSGSCGCGSSGSQKKSKTSTSPSDMRAPICWSPPSGPERRRSTGRPVCSVTKPPVVPVPMRMCCDSSCECCRAHSRSSSFMLSWATRAITFCGPTAISTSLTGMFLV